MCRLIVEVLQTRTNQIQMCINRNSGFGICSMIWPDQQTRLCCRMRKTDLLTTTHGCLCLSYPQLKPNTLWLLPHLLGMHGWAIWATCFWWVELCRTASLARPGDVKPRHLIAEHPNSILLFAWFSRMFWDDALAHVDLLGSFFLS